MIAHPDVANTTQSDNSMLRNAARITISPLYGEQSTATPTTATIPVDSTTSAAIIASARAANDTADTAVVDTVAMPMSEIPTQQTSVEMV